MFLEVEKVTDRERLIESTRDLVKNEIMLQIMTDLLAREEIENVFKQNGKTLKQKGEE